jgi:uncharacterized OB-fold protein
MNQHTSTAVDRFRDKMDHWFNTRIGECVHCRQCGANVSPWDDVCPTCGSGAPAKVSSSAGIVLVVAFLVLLLIAAIGAWLF